MKILAALFIALTAAMLAPSQDVIVVPGQLVERPKDLPALHDWSAILPEIKECTKWDSTGWEAIAGHPQWIVGYKYSRVRYDWIASRIKDFCATVRVEFTYRFTPPPEPKLTREQLREKKKLEDRQRETRKKLSKLSDFFPEPPPPRSFKLKGFPATEYFQSGCDTPPCPLRTRVSLRFAKNRILHVDAEATLAEVVGILNNIDFEKLNAEITRWVQTKEAGDKTKGPPVSEKP